MTVKTLTLITLLAVGAAAFQDAPEPPLAQTPHGWLQQLAGEWTVTAEVTMGPGSEPMRMESTESVRTIGDLWIQAEGSATFSGTPFTSIMTLGYDSRQEAFVGTWIDTLQAHLWIYEGQLDDAREVLTLSTEGPSFSDPTKLVEYRDVIELKSAEYRVLTSSVRDEEGTWTPFVRAHYRRKE